MRGTIFDEAPAAPGLTSAEARPRLVEFGANAVAEESPQRWQIFLSKFWSPVRWMLEAALLLQLGLGEYLEAAVVGALLLFKATLGLVQEGRAGAALAALKKWLAPTTLARCDGEWVRLPESQLVPGDAIRLRLGTLVLADAATMIQINIGQTAPGCNRVIGRRRGNRAMRHHPVSGRGDVYLHLRIATVLTAALIAAGCQTIGAGSVQRDRIGYADAIGASWKEQMLLNIVKLRYLDTPVFLDVSSVISSYELASEVNLSANVFPNTSAGNNRSLGVTGTYTDKPTISYTPITGERYMNSLIRPLSPQAIFAMIEAGHPADFLLRVTARAINGVYNYSVSQTRARAADPTFYRVTDAIRHIQQEGALSVRIEKRGDQQLTYIGFRHGGNQDVEKSIRSVKEALGINPSNDEPLLVFGSLHRNPDEIALLTRSVQEILTEFSAGVEVSERDLTEGRATPLLRPDPAAGPRSYPLMRIQSSSEPSADAYAGVRYRDRWFWIDDRDLNSKRMMMFLTVFSSLAETGVAPQIPLITIPAR